MLLNFQISNGNINLLKNTFDVDSNVIKTKIDLLKHTADLSHNKNVNIGKWIKWLSEPRCSSSNYIF